ncbi:hypothetical protein N2152v2_005988 [Parachlorella kessleri]
MSCTELITRSDAILKKYERWIGDPQQQREKTDDPFMDEYMNVMDRVQDLNLKAEEIAQEKNRALKAAMNAELRKSKAFLLEDAVPKLEKLVKKGKGLSTERIQERLQKLDELRAAIDDVPDGVHINRKPQRAYANGASGSGKRGEITVNGSAMDGRMQHADYYTHTDDTRAFQQEFEMAKQRQDKQLENIEKGLGTLKDIGEVMGETLKQHDVLIDAIDEKMDSVTKDLTTNNMKLKGMVTKVRSTRNFFIDIILICVLLAIGLYIYDMLK